MKPFSLIFSILIITISAYGASYGQTLRVISLSPALTEMIYALHFGDHLVGVSDFSNFPKEAKKLPSVGPYTKPNFEKIFDLKPDLVFLPLEGPEDVKLHLDQMRLKYKIVTMRKLKEIGESALQISAALQNPKVGIDFKKTWEKKTKELFFNPSKNIKTVFIEVQKDPLIAAGTETFLDEIVTDCGGKNIVKETGYPRLSLEFIATKDIDVVFLADYFKTPKEINAVKNWWHNQNHAPKQIETLDADTATRPGPRLIQGIKYICSKLKEEQNEN